jgi:hypothetical protein
MEALQTNVNYGPKRHISSGQVDIWLYPIRFVIPGVRHCPLFVLAVRVPSLFLLFVAHTVRQSWCISLLLKYSSVNNFIRLFPELRTNRFCSGRFTYLRIRVTSDKSSLNTFAGCLRCSAAFVSSALFPTVTLSVPRGTCQPRGLRGCHAEITTCYKPLWDWKKKRYERLLPTVCLRFCLSSTSATLSGLLLDFSPRNANNQVCSCGWWCCREGMHS